MRRLMGAALAAGTLAGALALTAAPAVAEERVCRGTIGARTVDNLRVPEGAVCRLRGTLVEGTITVQDGARLDARGVRVIGNVQAEGHRSVVLRRSRVGGSVQLVQGGAATVDADAHRGRSPVVRERPPPVVHPEPGGRQHAVQGERPRAHRLPQRRRREQGGPVLPPVTGR